MKKNLGILYINTPDDLMTKVWLIITGLLMK
jgi:hypothetical protein